jgi:hypothetical protein
MARLWLLSLTLVACGPSSAEIKQARTARYTCDFEKVFTTARSVMEDQQPPIEFARYDSGAIASAFRWHTASGMRKEAGAAVVNEGDVGFLVELAVTRAAEDGFHIRAQPRVFSQSPDSPRGREMTPEDANWPMWTETKVDKVLIEIRERLADCAISST